ncbi:hypothetical protein [Bradyrhizobium sp. STM 3562]|uniref:hypothetical protein n=1 Tax=Bradyrhizobium sp. STM 3562 TaxID=578924 RepID=UPI0038907F0B
MSSTLRFLDSISHLWDAECAACAGHNEEMMRLRILAALSASEFCIDLVPQRTEGAGKAGWPLHPGPPRQKIARKGA